MRTLPMTLLASALVTTGCMPAGAQTPAFPIPLEDRTAIEELVSAEVTAWNHGDARAFSARFAEDGSFTNIVGSTMHGREAFEAQHHKIFTTIYKDSRVAFLITKLRLLRPDVALADVDTTLAGVTRLPPGIQSGPDGALHTRLLMVMTREQGTWWISAFHNVAVAAPAPEPPRPKDPPRP